MRYRPRRGERGGFGGAEVVHKWQRRSLKSTCTANLERTCRQILHLGRVDNEGEDQAELGGRQEL